MLPKRGRKSASATNYVVLSMLHINFYASGVLWPLWPQPFSALRPLEQKKKKQKTEK